MTVDHTKELRALVPTLLQVLAADGVFVMTVHGGECAVAAEGSDEFIRALPDLLDAGARAQRGQGRPTDA